MDPKKKVKLDLEEADRQTDDNNQPIEVVVKHEKENDPVDQNGLVNKGISEEKTRCQDLKQMGRDYSAPDLADKFIDEGGTTEDMREALLSRLHAKAKAVEVEEIGLTGKEARGFSFMKAMRALAYPDNKHFREDAAFELECSAAVSEQTRVEPQGIYIPVEAQIANPANISRAQKVMQAMRVLDSTATDGAELIGTEHMGGSFIDVLRNTTRVIEAGATVMSSLQGDVAIPRKTSGSSAGWVAEDADAAESEAQFDQVTLTPLTLAAYTEYTRKLLLQSDPSIEALVRDDLARAAALEVDRAALHGSGAAGQPAGVENVTGINVVDLVVAGLPTWAETVSAETQIMIDNAPESALAYIAPAGIVGHWKTTPKEAGAARFIMEGGQVNGYNVLRTNQVTAAEFFFGAWSELLIGLFGGLDMLLDPYSNSLKGRVRIVIHQSMDIAVRHPVSFTNAVFIS